MALLVPVSPANAAASICSWRLPVRMIDFRATTEGGVWVGRTSHDILVSEVCKLRKGGRIVLGGSNNLGLGGKICARSGDFRRGSLYWQVERI